MLLNSEFAKYLGSECDNEENSKLPNTKGEELSQRRKFSTKNRHYSSNKLY